MSAAERTFVVPGKPSPKARARTMKSGITFTPKPTQLAESKVLECYLAAHRDAPPMDGPLALTLVACFEPPKSWSKRKIAAALARETHPTGRPDLDNIVKLATDALNGVAFGDDSQIVRVTASKMYAESARVHVRIRTIEPEVMPAT